MITIIICWIRLSHIISTTNKATMSVLFSFWYDTMSLSRWLFVESKLFEFAMEGVSVLLVFERSRGCMRFVSLGKETMHWLVAIME
jgi:hypothetical protein